MYAIEAMSQHTLALKSNIFKLVFALVIIKPSKPILL